MVCTYVPLSSPDHRAQFPYAVRPSPCYSFALSSPQHKWLNSDEAKGEWCWTVIEDGSSPPVVGYGFNDQRTAFEFKLRFG